MDQTQEKIDLSRTEAVLDALADALEARNAVQRVRERYQKMGNPADYGEKSLDAALLEPTQVYVTKLDALRAVLTRAGVQV